MLLSIHDDVFYFIAVAACVYGVVLISLHYAVASWAKGTSPQAYDAWKIGVMAYLAIEAPVTLLGISGVSPHARAWGCAFEPVVPVVLFFVARAAHRRHLRKDPTMPF